MNEGEDVLMLNLLGAGAVRWRRYRCAWLEGDVKKKEEEKRFY